MHKLTMQGLLNHERRRAFILRVENVPEGFFFHRVLHNLISIFKR